MKHIRFSKKSIFIVVYFICLIFFLSWFKVNTSSFFKETTNLNYNKNIEYIIIARNFPLAENIPQIEITDKEIIDNLFNYINSLEIIEGIGPSLEYRYSENYFTIYIYVIDEEISENHVDIISFDTRYLLIESGNNPICGCGFGRHDYYIKDSGYNPIDKSTKITQYLYDLLNQ